MNTCPERTASGQVLRNGAIFYPYLLPAAAQRFIQLN